MSKVNGSSSIVSGVPPLCLAIYLADQFNLKEYLLVKREININYTWINYYKQLLHPPTILVSSPCPFLSDHNVLFYILYSSLYVWLVLLSWCAVKVDKSSEDFAKSSTTAEKLSKIPDKWWKGEEYTFPLTPTM